MSVRSWAVGVVSAAAVVAGVVVVQSGIPGTAALPILPHRAAVPAPAAGGTELPAPTEAGAPPAAAGMVRTVSRASVPQRRTAVPTAPAAGPLGEGIRRGLRRLRERVREGRPRQGRRRTGRTRATSPGRTADRGYGPALIARIAACRSAAWASRSARAGRPGL